MAQLPSPRVLLMRGSPQPSCNQKITTLITVGQSFAGLAATSRLDTIALTKVIFLAFLHVAKDANTHLTLLTSGERP